jgi:hypothetical protein
MSVRAGRVRSFSQVGLGQSGQVSQSGRVRSVRVRSGSQVGLSQSGQVLLDQSGKVSQARLGQSGQVSQSDRVGSVSQVRLGHLCVEVWPRWT